MLLVALCCGVAPALQAESPIEVAGLRVGLAGYTQPGCWAPVSIDLVTHGAEFRGSVELVSIDSDGVPVSTSVPQVMIPRDSRATVLGHYRCESASLELTIVVRDEKGEQLTSLVADPTMASSTKSLTSKSLLVLGLGSPAGLNLLGEAETVSEPEATTSSTSVDVFVPMIDRFDELPVEWFAYGAADVLVIAADSANVWDSLDSARAAAIQTWVAQGGHLVISFANQWQTASQNSLGSLLPAKITGVETVGRLSPEVRSLESLAGDKASMEVGGDGMNVAVLQDVRGWTLPATASGKPEGSVVVRGVYGFGTVTLLAFDVNSSPFREWKDKRRFWTTILDAPRLADLDANGGMPGVSTIDPDIAVWIDSLLQSFPSVTVVPFSWVAMLILGYVLLIGPIDYFFLKKVLGKLEWTWFTFPLLVLLVSVAAYFAAFWLKGEKLLVNRVELIDIDQSSQCLRGESFVSIFSPNINRYTVTTEPSLGASGTWAELMRSRSSLDRISSSVGRLSGNDGYRTMAATTVLGTQGYSYSSPDPTTVLQAPIAVWSVKSFTSQWLAKGMRALDVDLAPGKIDDPTVLVGSITNRLGVPIEQAYLLWSDYAFKLGTIPRDQPIVLSTQTQETLSAVLGEFPDKLLVASGNDWWGGQSPMPTAGEEVRRQQGTAFSLGLTLAPRRKSGSKDQLVNASLDRWNLRSPLRAGRAVLIGQLAGPASKLWINEAPVAGEEPKPISGEVVQTTLVRIILELQPAGAVKP
jgi:hypothetical protein